MSAIKSLKPTWTKLIVYFSCLVQDPSSGLRKFWPFTIATDKETGQGDQ